jgi:hypothetical protein
VFVINCSKIVRILSALIVPANYNTAQRSGFSYWLAEFLSRP